MNSRAEIKYKGSDHICKKDYSKCGIVTCINIGELDLFKGMSRWLGGTAPACGLNENEFVSPVMSKFRNSTEDVRVSFSPLISWVLVRIWLSLAFSDRVHCLYTCELYIHT